METEMSNENQKPTQCERILRHLKDYGSIDPLVALKEYGIMRLASRMHELRKRGVEFDTETAVGKNRYGETTRYAVYRLKGE